MVSLVGKQLTRLTSIINDCDGSLIWSESANSASGGQSENEDLIILQNGIIH